MTGRAQDLLVRVAPCRLSREDPVKVCCKHRSEWDSFQEIQSLLHLDERWCRHHRLQCCRESFRTNVVFQNLGCGLKVFTGRVAIGQYDIVLANILAEPLCALAETLCQSTDVGGTLVLSGILQTQRDEVAAAYEGRAIVIDEYEQEGWVAMVLKTC